MNETRWWLTLGLLLATACGPRTSHIPANGAHQEAASPDGNGDGDGSGGCKESTTTETVQEGNVTKTITHVKKCVAPPDPVDRPADGWPADPLVKYNVDVLNKYRAQNGVAPLKYDASIAGYALDGSKQLSKDHTPHQHFIATAQGSPVLGTRSAENQGDWNGVPVMDADPLTNGKKQIDVMMKLMMDEGPGGGHHDNMLDPRMKRVGIGLYSVGGLLYLTNDFSN